VVKAEENLLLQSQTFDNASWTDAGAVVTVVANAATAPDGTVTADSIAEIATTASFAKQQAPSLVASTTYVLSCYVKDVDVQYVGLNCFGVSNNYVYAEFDLTGVSVNRSAALGSGWSISSSSITASTEGFYRIVLIFTTGSTVTTPRVRLFLSDGAGAITTNGIPSYTGVAKSAYFWGAQLEQRSSVTAYNVTTTQPITRYQRQLKTAAANEWPREFDPVTGECLGRSVWESRTNLLTYSEDFTNAAWTKTRASITANQIIAPDGALTADKLVEDTTASNSHQVVFGVTTIASSVHTGTIYAKAAERSWLLIQIGATTAGLAYFNLADGTVGTVTGGYTATITSVGNGWYRCSLAGTIAGTSTNNFRVYLATANGTFSYTGDGYSGIYIWGAQLEAGAFATPYIPTVASQVTRLADSAVMTGTNFSQWFNPEQGCILAEYSRVIASVAAANDGLVLQIDDGTNSNRILAGNVNNGGNSSITDAVVTGGSSQEQTFPLASGFVANTFYKQSFSYKTNDFKGCVNGGTVTTDALGVTPVVTQIKIGQRISDSFLNGYLKRLTYYSQALTAANHQAITR
jgi:hypothetical protein